MSFSRIPARSLSITLCVVLLAALVPAATMAAPGGKTREYIVTLSVADSGRTIQPSNRSAKQRIRQRVKSAKEATNRVTREHGVKARHRYGHAVTGFSTKMTPAQAAEMAQDPEVVLVRPARVFKVSGQTVQPGVKRVKGWANGTVPGPDVNAHVAVIDTGIGPAFGSGEPIAMTPIGAEELNIQGGVNCYDNNGDGFWGDTFGHGTHVAGVIGARDNNVGAVGVAPGVNLWSVRVFNGVQGSETTVLCGLNWVIATHSNANPDIDVVNMSIQGGRLDYQESCPAILADPGADPMQQAICTATSMGITVVASAGNSAVDANNSAPGGFDQVISVAAMNDTDGVGWGNGPNAGCPGYGGSKDDHLAGYSNYGPEVDIVAPGTCVASTSHADPTGNALETMTGTSMAAPHVTGAVARYIAAHGRPGSTATMRQLVRAAGRMDWEPKSDPLWSGVNDANPPNRVLDAAALIGGSFLKAFVYHNHLIIGGNHTIRTTRVDIQRGGGYTGTASLSVAGLPASSASASFDVPHLSGLGNHQLGTRVHFRPNLSTKVGDGIHGANVIVSGPGVAAHARPIGLTVDRTGPSVANVKPKPRAAKVSLGKKGAAQVYVEWNSGDALSSVASTRLQRKNAGKPWRFAGTLEGNRSRVSLKPGQGNLFRVRGVDSLGNVRFSRTIAARLSIRDSKAAGWGQPTGQWHTKKVPKAFNKSVLMAKSPGAGVLWTRFKGKAVALASSIGPSRGKFRVRIDRGPWNVVDLKSPTAGHKRIVWSRMVPAGSHLVEIRGLQGQTVIDALLIVR